MGERILVPFDGSALSEQALEHAVTKHSDAEITILHVVDPIGVVYEAEAHGLPETEKWTERSKAAAERLCERAAEVADEADCTATTAVEFGKPSRAILEYVEDHDIDHVIMGSHGRSGVSRLVLGSTAERVMRHSPVPVTVVR